MKKKSPIDQIFDENDSDNIVLHNEKGQAVEFEQIAVIPLHGEALYVILRPVVTLPGLAEDEALVFAIVSEYGEEVLKLVEEDAVIDEVFAEYYELLREAGVDTDD